MREPQGAERIQTIQETAMPSGVTFGITRKVGPRQYSSEEILRWAKQRAGNKPNPETPTRELPEGQPFHKFAKGELEKQVLIALGSLESANGQIIAHILDTHPSGVSEAIRKLDRKGKIVRTGVPPGGSGKYWKLPSQ